MTEKNTPAKREGGIIDALRSPQMADQFAAVLPSFCAPERFCRFALTAVRKVPKLQECSKESVMSAFMTCAELGIEPDGRRAHLIPYGKEATLIIDYKGLIELMLRSGKVVSVRAEIVCENDGFDWLNGVVQHRVEWRKPRGKMQAVYAEAKLDNGEVQTAVMTLEEVEAIRNRSKAGKSGPWVTDFPEMAKKTAVRRLAKMVPLSAEISTALEKDGDQPGPAPSTGPSKPLFDVGPGKVSDEQHQETEQDADWVAEAIDGEEVGA